MTAEWRFHSTSSCSSLCNLIRLHQAQIAAIWELYALCQVNVLTSCCNSDNKHDISMNKADYSGPVVSPVVIETLDVFTLLTSIQMYSLHSVNFGLLTVWLKCIFTSSETETSENQRVKAGGERSCVPTPYILIIYRSYYITVIVCHLLNMYQLIQHIQRQTLEHGHQLNFNILFLFSKISLRLFHHHPQFISKFKFVEHLLLI